MSDIQPRKTEEQRMKINVRVEYECTPIRHIAVQCPECQNWFIGYDITDDELFYSHQIYQARFECPVCGKEFCGAGGNYDNEFDIHECAYSNEVYRGCLQKKTTWEKAE